MPFPPPSERQARLIWFAVAALAVVLLGALFCLLVWGVGRVLQVLSPVLWPLAVAGVLAYLLDPVVDALEARRLSRGRAILCVFALALALVAGVAGSVLPQVVLETRLLVGQIPAYTNKVRTGVEQWMSRPPGLLQHWLGRGETHVVPDPGTALETNDPAGPDDVPPAPVPAPAPAASAGGGPASEPPSAATRFIEELLSGGRLQSATDWVGRVLPKLGAWLFGQVTRVASWFGVLAGLALVPVYLFYFLLEKRSIQSHWTRYLPLADSGFKDELVFVLNSINDYLIAFFRGQVLVAICDGVLYAVGFTIIGLPYAVLLGVVATVLTIIPYLGAIVTCLAALLIALVQFGDLLHPLLVLAVFAVVQALEGFFIQPKIVGDRVGLHPLAIIVAVMVGTTLFGGLLGGILAIPLTAALRVVMFRYVWRRPGPASPQ